MSSGAAQGTTEDIYTGVMKDVINTVKDFFLDEPEVEANALHELEAKWQAKLRTSCAVDLDGRAKQPKLLLPPPIKGGSREASGGGAGSAANVAQSSAERRLLISTSELTQAGVHKSSPSPSLVRNVTGRRPATNATPLNLGTHSAASNIQFAQQISSAHAPSQSSNATAAAAASLMALGGGPLGLPSGFRLAQLPAAVVGGNVAGAHQLSSPGTSSAAGQLTQYTLLQAGPGGRQQLVLLPSAAMGVGGVREVGGPTAISGLGTMTTTRLVPGSTHQQQQISATTRVMTPSGSGQQHLQLQQQQQPGIVVHRPRPMVAVKREHDSRSQGPAGPSTSSSHKPAIKRIHQLDGKGVGMSDSSSSEDETIDDGLDEEEYDDPIHRFVGTLAEGDEAGAGEAESGVVEEEPLNSGDDQSDDEDAETLFSADNVVVCQFEKVHRARSKWKFALREGVMHIDGRDHCFQRCVGEAEF